MGVIEHAIGVVTNPTETFEDIADQRPLGEAALIVVGVPVLIYVAAMLLLTPFLGAGSAGLMGASLFLMVPIYAITSTISWLFQGVIYHIALRLVGGKGFFTGTLCVIAFSAVIGFVGAIILTPFIIIAAKTDSMFLVLLGSAAIGIWNLWVILTGSAVVHDISRLRAFAAILLMVFLFGLIWVGFVLVGIASLSSVMDPEMETTPFTSSQMPSPLLSSIPSASPVNVTETSMLFADSTVPLPTSSTTSTSVPKTTSTRVITADDLILDCDGYCRHKNYTSGSCERSPRLCASQDGVNFNEGNGYCERPPLMTCCCFGEESV